jgi:hypothetical protein
VKLKNVKRKQFLLNCEGHDEYLVVDYVDYNDDDQEILYLSHVIPSFYAYQRPFRDHLRRMFKMIWSAITGKEYSFFDIVIYSKDGELQKFKEFVASL